MAMQKIKWVPLSNRNFYTLFFIILFSLYCPKLLCQDDSESSKYFFECSIIKHNPNSDYGNNSLGGSVSYGKKLKLLGDTYLFGNFRFVDYEVNNVDLNDYSASLGLLNTFNDIFGRVGFYNGVELGGINKENATSKVVLLSSIFMGAVFPITEKIATKVDIRVQYNTYDEYHICFGFGLMLLN